MSKHLKLPTFLIIADNPYVLSWMKKHLSPHFFTLEATNERQAIKTIETAPLDFIVLDAEFEDCNALDLCRKLRRIAQNTIVPILLITGRLKKSFREEALESGVTDFLSNELDAEELETRIATAEKAVSVRKKTEGLSSSFQKSEQQITNHYLKNKFLLHDQALRVLAAAKKENKPVVLLILQIDSFEKIQKEVGYFAADQILLPVHDFINQFLREGDLLIPYSDGRLILLLPNISVDKAKRAAERLRKEIQQHPFETKHNSHQLTLSIAYTSFDANESTMNRMIEAAMKALKQAQATTNLIISIDQEMP